MHNGQKFDCTGFGHAVKQARNRVGLTREQVGEMLDLAPRYLLSIENKGQHPSLQVLYNLATMFQISIDQFFFPDRCDHKRSRRSHLDTIIDELDDEQLPVIEATATALHQMRSRQMDAIPVPVQSSD